jgi:L-alanine-DL-glutamate epimerase-like enolase superfamily enzyme
LTALAMPDLESALGQTSVWAALSAVANLVPANLPSARMALETAALDLIGQRQGLPAPRLLGAAADTQRDLAQLLGPAGSPSLLQEAERERLAGFRHFKLKLGAPGQLERELVDIAALRKRYPQLGLRLDANGALSASEITQAWQSLSQLDIELFEEPGAVPDALLGALPLGLDESLQGLDEAAALALLAQRRARCLVLKPMALGGLTHCWRLAEQARALGAGVVISHCFDGPFAWRAAAALALALPAGLAHGLAPHAGMAAWTLGPLPVVHGYLKMWSEPGLAAAAEPDFA